MIVACLTVACLTVALAAQHVDVTSLQPKWQAMRIWWSESSFIRHALKWNSALGASGAALAWLGFTAADRWGPHGWVVGCVGAAVSTVSAVLYLLDNVLRVAVPIPELEEIRVGMQELRQENARQRRAIELLDIVVVPGPALAALAA
jgi:hypothetical protein